MREMTQKQKQRRENRLQRKEEERALLEKQERERLVLQEKEDIRFMKQAITQAKKAAKLNEVPIGCVIVRKSDQKVIARGYNRRNTDKSTLSHAEMMAIRRASRRLGDWRLEGCTLYVTLEPCQMCAGAIVQARVDEVVIGAMNPKAGCCGSIINLLENEQFNHQVETRRGICEQQCSRLLTDFFRALRISRRAD